MRMDFAPSGFFHLRTPLLSFDEFLAWSSGLKAPLELHSSLCLEQAIVHHQACLRDRLRAIVSRPEVQEALFIASPSLYSRLNYWLHEPNSEKGQKVEQVLVRYFARMTGRATPFGLFSGCSVGKVGTETCLIIEERSQYQRHTRLDMAYICALINALGGMPWLRNALVFFPNSSLYQARGCLRYVERYFDDGKASYRLADVELTNYIQKILNLAREGAYPAMLAEELANTANISLTEAEEYIGQLIENQILVPNLPNITGVEPIYNIIAQLRQCVVAHQLVDCLEQVQRMLEEMDKTGLGVAPERYHTIFKLLEDLPCQPKLPLFHVDMIKPAPKAILGQKVLEEIIQGVEILHRLFASHQDPIAHFREAFIERYGDQAVPLVEALDNEEGVGFGASEEASPLVQDLVFPFTPSENVLPSDVQTLLLRKFENALRHASQEIILEPKDLEELQSRDQLPLPDAFAVVAVIAASSEKAIIKGDFRILLEGISGPSGARLLGRFCHSDNFLKQEVEQHLRAEEASQPEAIFAEIVHLPESRIGNVILRPILRNYEIPYLGNSGAPLEKQIPITDLLIMVRDNRIVLYSSTLGREIIPRLTNAHNFGMLGFGVYRFLCLLQQQGNCGGLIWNWGILNSASFLPRVVFGRVVLSRARWLISKQELQTISEAQGLVEQFQSVQKLRKNRGLPRFVLLTMGDNELLIDLDNVLSIKSFISIAKKYPNIILTEMFPSSDQLFVQDPKGSRFKHELVIPFVRIHKTTRRNSRYFVMSAKHNRSFIPSSEWLYIKLYMNPAIADEVLLNVIKPVTQEFLKSEAVDLWFFIRFGDPRWHLRLRLHGSPKKLLAEVFPALQEALATFLEKGRIWRVQFDTYEREINRYGGEEGVKLAERLFHVDSEAVIEILQSLHTLRGDEIANARWRFCLKGIDMLLNDFGLDLNARYNILKQARDMLAKEFHVNSYFEGQLSSKFRKERKNLETLLKSTSDEKSLLKEGLAALHRRSKRLISIVTELKTCEQEGRLSIPIVNIVPSYIHMYVNRMLRSAHRKQELVIYDFLIRLYESQIARARGRQIIE